MSRAPDPQRGVALIEVLVAMLIIAFGILGFVGLQARTAVTNLEGYQRAQALILVNDMVQRLNANRKNAAAYATAFENGAAYLGATVPASCTTGTQADKDLCEWSRAIGGLAEQDTSGNLVGAVISPRGCVKALDAANNVYLVALFWQGARPTGASPVACGPGTTTAPTYSDAKLRRAVSVVVRIGKLS